MEKRSRSTKEQSILQDREGEKAKDQAEMQTVSQLIRITKHVKHGKICLYCHQLGNPALNILGTVGTNTQVFLQML